MITKTEDERFRDRPQDYVAYLRSPDGRLRLDLAFANLEDWLAPSQRKQPMSALDVGCGSGTTAVRLAQLGFAVTGVDSSAAMLEIARRSAEEADLAGKISLHCLDAAHLREAFPAASFDVILCHNLLEYVDDPAAVIRGVGGLLRDAAAIVSIVVRNRAGEVLKAAIKAGDLATAGASLTAEWGTESLYGGRVRLFTPAELKAMLHAESLELVAHRGIRVVSDYLPETVSRDSKYAHIMQLEQTLGSQPEFAAIARYTQLLARRVGAA